MTPNRKTLATPPWGRYFHGNHIAHACCQAYRDENNFQYIPTTFLIYQSWYQIRNLVRIYYVLDGKYGPWGWALRNFAREREREFSITFFWKQVECAYRLFGRAIQSSFRVYLLFGEFVGVRQLLLGAPELSRGVQLATPPDLTAVVVNDGYGLVVTDNNIVIRRSCSQLLSFQVIR